MSMRPLYLSIVSSAALLLGGAFAQSSSTEKAAKADPSTKVSPMIFEQGPPPPRPVKPPPVEATAPVEKAQKMPEAPPPAPAEPTAPSAPTVTVERVDAPPLELKEVTAQDLARVKVGSSEKELKAILGPPASRVMIPDDDGRLNETLQFWGNGKLQAIVRLENGKVVSVEGRK